MKIEDLRKNWEAFGETDPLWSILTHPAKKDNKWDEEEFFQTGIRAINQLLKRTRNNLKIPFSNRKALDFGCGVGRCTQALANHFDEVVGIDIADSMIKLAKHYNSFPDRVDYLQTADPQLALLASESFSFIYSHITLQHIHPRYSKMYLKSFIRILEPGGILYFQLPSAPPKSLAGTLYKVLPAGILNLYRKIKYGKSPVMEMHYIDAKELEQHFQGAGAKIIHQKAQVLKDGFTSNWYYVKKV